MNTLKVLGLVLLGLVWTARAQSFDETVQSLGIKEPIITSKIIGGLGTSPGDYPYMVSLRYPEGSFLEGQNVAGQHFCGGALIEKNIVLTAGHCLQAVGFQNVDAHIGRFEREGDDEGRFQAFKTIDSKVHPDFDSFAGWNNYDVALLVLDGESQVSPIPYAKNEDGISTGVASVVIGWGHTEDNNPNSLSDRLLQAEVPLVSRGECQNLYKGGSSVITSSMICAGKEGVDACQFDSGGPLLLNQQVIGLVSWGAGCGEVPGVYSSMGATANWIESQIRDINQEPQQACVFRGGIWLPPGCNK